MFNVISRRCSKLAKMDGYKGHYRQAANPELRSQSKQPSGVQTCGACILSHSIPLSTTTLPASGQTPHACGSGPVPLCFKIYYNFFHSGGLLSLSKKKKKIKYNVGRLNTKTISAIAKLVH